MSNKYTLAEDSNNLLRVRHGEGNLGEIRHYEYEYIIEKLRMRSYAKKQEELIRSWDNFLDSFNSDIDNFQISDRFVINSGVYFIEFHDKELTNCVKIGHSSNIKNRIKQLTKEYGKLNVLYTMSHKIKSNRELEIFFHDNFFECSAKYQFKNEFFLKKSVLRFLDFVNRVSSCRVECYGLTTVNNQLCFCATCRHMHIRQLLFFIYNRFNLESRYIQKIVSSGVSYSTLNPYIEFNHINGLEKVRLEAVSNRLGNTNKISEDQDNLYLSLSEIFNVVDPEKYIHTSPNYSKVIENPFSKRTRSNHNGG